MDTEFIKYLSTLGVGGSIAALMFMFYRKDVAMYTSLWKNQSEQLMQVVKENSVSITYNTKLIEVMLHKMDKME